MMDDDTPPPHMIPKGIYKVKVDNARFDVTRTRGTRYIRTNCHLLGSPEKKLVTFTGDAFGPEPYVARYNKGLWEFLKFPDTTGWKPPREIPELIGRIYRAEITIMHAPYPYGWINRCVLRSLVSP